MSGLIDLSDNPEAVAQMTGGFSYLSLFGLLILILVPLVLVVFLRYFVRLLRKKPLPDTKTWMGGLGIYLILAGFFSTDFGYVYWGGQRQRVSTIVLWSSFPLALRILGRPILEA